MTVTWFTNDDKKGSWSLPGFAVSQVTVQELVTGCQEQAAEDNAGRVVEIALRLEP